MGTSPHSRARASRRASSRSIERSNASLPSAWTRSARPAPSREGTRDRSCRMSHGAAHTADDGHGGSAGVGMRFFAWTVNLLLAVTLLIAAVRVAAAGARVSEEETAVGRAVVRHGARVGIRRLRLAHG